MVDGSSSDDTVAAAAAARAPRWRRRPSLMPDHGPVLGKGDAMWRALSAVTGDVVAYIDADTRDFDARFVNGLVGPLLTDPELRFVKATYRRPFTAGGLEVPGRRRPGQPAHGAPAAGRVLPRAGRADPAAGGRGGGHARAAGVDPVRHRLRGGDGDAAGRVRDGGRPARWPSATWASGATTTSRWTPCGRWPRPCWRWCAERQGLDTAGPEIVTATPPARDEPALRVHRPGRHPAGGRRLAVPRRPGRVHAAAGARAGGLPPGRASRWCSSRAGARPRSWRTRA